MDKNHMIGKKIDDLFLFVLICTIGILVINGIIGIIVISVIMGG